MTKADRELVELTAELTVTKAISKMKEALSCNEHGEDLEVLKSTLKDTKKHTEENWTHGNNDRKMIITGMALLIIGEVVMKIFL